MNRRECLVGMRPAVQKLHEIQDFICDNMYPGYPFTCFVVVDMKEEKAILDDEQFGLEELGQKLGYTVARCALDCKDAHYGSWLDSSRWGDPKKIIDEDYDEFWISDSRLVRLWLAVTAVVNKCKAMKENGKECDVVVVAALNEECDYLTLEVFDNITMEQAQRYVNEYCTGDPDEEYEFEDEEEEN